MSSNHIDEQHTGSDHKRNVGDALEMARPHIGLMDLPNELLLHIFESPEILTKDLYVLSILGSRRITSMALPLFLSQQGVQNPVKEAKGFIIEWDPEYFTKSKRPDVLAALNIAAVVGHPNKLSKIDDLRCYFQDPDARSISERNTFQQAFHLSHAVRRVKTLVKRLDHLGRLELSLIWDPYFVLRDKSMTHVAVDVLKDWRDAFGGLLNAVVERGCEDLFVQYDVGILQPGFKFKTKKIKGVWRIWKGLFGRDNSNDSCMLEWDYIRPVHDEDRFKISEELKPVMLSTSAEQRRGVQSLSIHSDVLLSPPFVNWTLSLLRTHSSLTSLSFAFVMLSRDNWLAVLPSIATAVSGRITSLSIQKNCPHLEAEDLLWFVSQLPNLTQLSFDRTYGIRFHFFKRTQASRRCLPALKKLEVLQAPTEFLDLLFNPEHVHPYSPTSRLSGTTDVTDIALPRLKSLILYPSNPLLYPARYPQATRTINNLVGFLLTQRKGRDVDIKFTLDIQMEFVDFAPVVNFLRRRYALAEIEVHPNLWDTLGTPSSEGSSRSSLSLDPSPGNINGGGGAGSLSKPVVAFIHVTHLVLLRFGRGAEENVVDYLCVWLQLLFPNLVHLTFRRRFALSAGSSSSKDPGEVESVYQNVVQDLIGRLRDKCPKIRTVVVGEQTFSI